MVEKLQEPVEGSCNKKFMARDFRPPRGVAPTEFPYPPLAAPHRQASETPQLETCTTPTSQAQSRRGTQAQEHNPHPAPQMHIGTGFGIRTDINAEAVNRVNIPHTDNGRHFCLLYHLKVVRNTHCGGRHLHRPLSQNKFGWLGDWGDRYCDRDEVPML